MTVSPPVAQKTIGIIGAAIAGPVFALQILTNSILRSRYKTILYDRDRDPHKASFSESSPTGGAAVALFPNGLHPLYKLGLKDAIAQATCDATGLSFWRASYGAPRRSIGLNSVEASSPGAYKHYSTQNASNWAPDLQSSLRILERPQLQSLLVNRVRQLGGEIHWNKALHHLKQEQDGRISAIFNDGHVANFDLVVGADGAWSKVRKHILQERNPSTTEGRWVPDFSGISGLYGISSKMDPLSDAKNGELIESAATNTHGIMLDRGNLSSSPLPGGKMRWDLQVPEEHPPLPSSSKDSPMGNSATTTDPEMGWQSKIVPGLYSNASTKDILLRHKNVFHPAGGTFGRILSVSERIIHSPLRQRVWNKDEIQHRNVVLIGDAARLLLPSSGQGTSFAVEDATVLADALFNNPASDGEEGCEAALEEYARKRLPRSEKMATVAYWTGKMALGDTWYYRWILDFGFWVGSTRIGKIFAYVLFIISPHLTGCLAYFVQRSIFFAQGV